MRARLVLPHGVAASVAPQATEITAPRAYNAGCRLSSRPDLRCSSLSLSLSRSLLCAGWRVERRPAGRGGREGGRRWLATRPQATARSEEAGGAHVHLVEDLVAVLDQLVGVPREEEPPRLGEVRAAVRGEEKRVLRRRRPVAPTSGARLLSPPL